MKKVTIWLLVITFIFVLSGCNNQEQEKLSSENLITSPIPITENDEIAPISYDNVHQSSELLTEGNNTYVGFGYDVLNNTYIDPLSFSLSNPILKEEEVQKQLKTRIPNAKSSANIIGSSVSEYSKQLSVKLNLSADYPMFSGSVSGEYDLNQTKKENTYFIKSMSGYIKSSDFINNSVNLKTILDDTFKKDLNSNMEPKKLFEKYGTHLLTEALMGARCTYNYTYTSSSSQKKSEILAKVDTTYSYISGSASDDQKKEATEFLSNTYFQSMLTGGADIDASTMPNLLKNFPTWVASLKDTTPTIYGISNINSLTPIWELTDNADRATALEKAFKKMGGDVKSFLDELSKIPEKPSGKTYIESVIIISDKNKNVATDGSSYPGYTMIDKDLNKDAGGDYIYLWYNTTTDPDKALRDIRFTYDSFKDIPQFYTKNDHDLNKGASGAYIYMWTTKQKSIGKPITGINIYYGENADMPSGYEVGLVNNKESKTRAELNYKAGGEFIFLGYTNE
ncbi:hypothetical protein GC105_00115 [Alkalibaculum sp. M08DMB]|uniref:MACPF domain-containing protein n=1 Tax=Alkalibaculum sporogenes TaxID=2655001 RepID=A0A6A7K4X4_9FIRM|nr:MAC/perforin domain-containing protein [Alkalibaculum sporogenes]MPW24203.1 hypothetical protein [Alkalibaculum sporogenes]